MAIGFIINVAARPVVDKTLLKRLFDLTDAEANLATSLVAGDGLESVATDLGISRNTVKSQLQSVFQKTQTQRQAQLVSLLHSLNGVVRTDE